LLFDFLLVGSLFGCRVAKSKKYENGLETGDFPMPNFRKFGFAICKKIILIPQTDKMRAQK